MKTNNSVTESEPDKSAIENPPVREADVPLTPKEQAKVANKLPRSEQMKKFETFLEVHDSGNQPS